MAQKLKGIYDALDHSNWKNCLKLCTAFLQKQPGHALCKALYAVALERSGRRDEALKACEEALASSVGMDETVFSTVQVVYRRCRQFAAITQMYQAICTKDPDSEEYAIALFSSSVRSGDYARAQQVATKLYSKHKKNKFLHWVVVSLLLQARSGASAKAADLAAMMLQKAPVDKDAPRADAPFNRTHLYLVLLHLDTLRSQRKFDAALALLEASESSVRLPADVDAIRIQLLRSAGQAKEAAQKARARVLRDPEDWRAAQEYIHLAFECQPPADLPSLDGVAVRGAVDHCARLRPGGAADGGCPTLQELEDVTRHATDDEVWNAFLLFRYLRLTSEQQADDGNSAAKHGCSRTARLAELELWRMAFCANEAGLAAPANDNGRPPVCATIAWKASVRAEDFECFVAALEEFVGRYGCQNQCFFDLKCFLALLDEGTAAALLDRIRDTALQAHGTDVSMATLVARLRRAFRRYEVGDETLLTDAAAEVDALLAQSKQLLEASGSGGQPDATLPDFMLLVIVSLVDMDRAACRARPAEGRRYLLDALALAEDGIARYPRLFQFKVLLVLLHGLLGLTGSMLKWYQQMDIKNVQHESLSFLVFDQLCAFGNVDALRGVAENILQFHEDMDKDGSEALHVAMQSGVYHRTTEYIDALDRTGRSLLWCRALVEAVFCEVGQAQTWDAVVDAVTRQRVLLAGVMRQDPALWVLGNQDRCLLNGLIPLPPCSPLGESAYSARTWRGGAAAPVVSLQGAPAGDVGSSGLLWRAAAGAAAGGAPEAADSAPAAAAFEPPARGGAAAAEGGQAPLRSAVEELLRPAEAWPPAAVRLAAALQHLLAALLAREGPAAEAVAESLEAARAAGAAAWPAAGAGGAGGAGGACASGGAAARGVRAALAMGVVAGEAAQCVRACSAGADAWEKAEERLAELGASLQSALGELHAASRGVLGSVRDSAASEPASDQATPGVQVPGARAPGACAAGASLGQLGVELLWAFLHHGAGVALPVVLWCCTALPKASSGKKAKQGQEGLHGARVAARNVLSALQCGLADLSAQLGRALEACQDGAAEGGAAGPLGPPRGADDASALGALPGHRERCEQVARTASEAHRRHLQALQEAVACRLALVKSRGPFKP